MRWRIRPEAISHGLCSWVHDAFVARRVPESRLTQWQSFCRRVSCRRRSRRNNTGSSERYRTQTSRGFQNSSKNSGFLRRPCGIPGRSLHCDLAFPLLLGIALIRTCLLSELAGEQRCLTPRSSGAPTAGHQARAGGTRYIFASPGPASCRRRPLNSNVRPHKNRFLRVHAGNYPK